jgi:hypothetical protein
MAYENVIKDVLKVKGSGLYAITPFDNIQTKGEMIIKIGISVGPLSKRVSQYHTYFRNGLYILGLFETPPVRINGFKKKYDFYRHIELEIAKYIVKHGGKQLKQLTSDTMSEWFYVKPAIVHKAFQEMARRYLNNDKGGAYHPFEVKGAVDKHYNDNINRKDVVVGEILFNDI